MPASEPDGPVPTGSPGAWQLLLGRQVHLRRPGGDLIALDGQGALLAARLALDGPQPREPLARQFWPDADAARARGNLRQRLLRLKTQAGHAWIDGQDRLALAADVHVHRLEGEPLLPELPEPTDDTLALWLQGERRRWQQRQQALARQRLHEAETAQRPGDAQTVAAAWVALEPDAEEPRRALARAHYLGGDRARALAELDALAVMLQRVHGAQPSAASLELRRAVLSATAPGRRREVPAVLLRPPRMVGRDSELKRLEQVLAEGAACLVLGEAGLGKSRLLAETLQARAGAEAALAVKAQAGDAGVPYATLARLLRRLIETRHPTLPVGAPGTALSRLLPELRQGDVPLPLPGDGLRLVLQEALQALWRRCGVRAVAVDDLHFADAASVELLQALVADERLADVAWLLLQRPAEGDGAVQALAQALAESGRLQLLRLQALDEAAVAELVTSLGLGLDSATWAPRLHRHTGGNPLFVLETLKQLQAEDVATGRLPASATVGALIEQRLKALSPAAIALARVAAVAGADFGPTLAECVSGRPALDLADAWSELEAAQVLRERSFAHDLVLDAVRRGMPLPIRQHLHAEVARQLERHGGEAARIAMHWIDAGNAVSARPWLRRAAEAARLALRPREAADFLRLALDADPPASERFELAMAWQAAVADSAGPAAALPALQRAAESVRHATESVAVVARRASLLVDIGQYAEAVACGQEALVQALALGAHELAVQALSSTASAMAISGQPQQAEDLMAKHWPLVEQLDPPSIKLHSDRAVVLDRLGLPAQARRLHQRAIALAREQGQVGEEIVATINLSSCLTYLGEVNASDDAAAACEALHARHEGLAAASHFSTLQRASMARDLGQYRTALERFEAGMAHAAGQSELQLQWARVQRSWLWIAIGQWARAQQDLQAVNIDALPVWGRSGHALMRARLMVALGKPAQVWLDRADQELPAGSEPFLRLQIATLRAGIASGELAPGEALQTLEELRAAAVAHGYAGLQAWIAVQAAQAALAAGNLDAARRHALACEALPAAVTPRLPGRGLWWHGQWRVWQGLRDVGRAEAARAEGVAWIHRTLQRELPSEFHAAFRDAVPAHRALLSARAPGGHRGQRKRELGIELHPRRRGGELPVC